MTRDVVRLRLLVPLLLAGALAGCVPFPHFSRTQPEIDGVILVGGAPRAGIEVSACLGYIDWKTPDRRPTCEKHVVTTTDANGHFHLEGYGHIVMFLWLAPDASSAFGLAVKDGERTDSFVSSGFGLSPTTLDYVCTFDDKLLCRQRETSRDAG